MKNKNTQVQEAQYAQIKQIQLNNIFWHVVMKLQNII